MPWLPLFTRIDHQTGRPGGNNHHAPCTKHQLTSLPPFCYPGYPCRRRLSPPRSIVLLTLRKSYSAQRTPAPSIKQLCIFASDFHRTVLTVHHSLDTRHRLDSTRLVLDNRLTTLVSTHEPTLLTPRPFETPSRTRQDLTVPDQIRCLPQFSSLLFPSYPVSEPSLPTASTHTSRDGRRWLHARGRRRPGRHVRCDL